MPADLSTVNSSLKISHNLVQLKNGEFQCKLRGFTQAVFSVVISIAL